MRIAPVARTVRDEIAERPHDAWVVDERVNVEEDRSRACSRVKGAWIAAMGEPWCASPSSPRVEVQVVKRCRADRLREELQHALLLVRRDEDDRHLRGDGGAYLGDELCAHRPLSLDRHAEHLVEARVALRQLA
jgi:hypothetical protein